MSLEEKKSLFRSGDVKKIKQFLLDNPTLDFNEDLDHYNWSPLHYASIYGQHKIVSLFLSHPNIDVNKRDTRGRTPFILCCCNGFVEVAKVLMKDPRVNINLSDHRDHTPLLGASYFGHIGVIKWMIALRGNEINLDMKGQYGPYDSQYNAIEIARKQNKSEVFSLLERFKRNKEKTICEIQFELRTPDALAVELFAATVFLCDDFLKIKEPVGYSSTTTTTEGAVRFFRIVRKMPMELQMVLCYRVYGSAKINILSHDSEVAFQRLCSCYSPQRKAMTLFNSLSDLLFSKK